MGATYRVCLLLDPTSTYVAMCAGEAPVAL